MRHLKKGRKFSRSAGQRKALLRNLSASLIEKGRIITTEAKAKEVRPFVEKVIAGGRVKSIAGARMFYSKLPEGAADKIIKDLGERFSARKGGYTRIIKLGTRKGDGARMAMIEFVE